MSDIMLKLTVSGGKTVKAPIKNITFEEETENCGQTVGQKTYEIESGKLYDVNENEMVEL